MASVIVVGAGLGGLSTAMLLALDGHDVTVLERDPQPPPGDPEEAWTSWERRGVNQFRLPHFMLPRWREVLERELPQVAACLDERGALRFNQVDALPVALTGGALPGDERFQSLTARRPTLEAGVAAAAACTYGVRVRRGVSVEGLLTGDQALADVPHVVGVRTADGEDLHADLVVDHGGRRSALPEWLAGIGARPPYEELEDCGFVYFGRHFRSTDGSLPESHAFVLQAYDSVSILTLPSDGGTWCVAFVASAADRVLLGLRTADQWHATLDRYPRAAHWGAGEPISDVQVMAGIPDRYRRFVVDGQPVATGVLAVADAWACTNPSLGRGAAIGLVHGCCLRDLLREVPVSDPAGLACRWDELTETVVTPLYRSTLTYDRHRLGELDADREGRAYETGDPSWGFTRAFAKAAYADPIALRDFLRITSALALPPDVLAEPGVLDRVLELGGGATSTVLPGPDRTELLASAGRY